MGCGDTRLKWGERDNYKIKVNLIYYRRFENQYLFLNNFTIIESNSYAVLKVFV
jgi:hypothetical protein